MTATASLASLLSPKSVAIVGASSNPQKYAARFVASLVRHGYSGQMYFVNPLRSEIDGRTVYPSIESIPGRVEVAVLCVPRESIRAAVIGCGEKGVGLCVVIASQFAEASSDGGAEQNELVAIARAHGMRLVGPNCLGFVNLTRNVALSPSRIFSNGDTLLRGGLAIVSQSGAIMATLAEKAQHLGLGLSFGITLGNEADLSAAELISVLADDAVTRVICCYLEGLRDAPAFFSALSFAREKGKQVIVLKSGRTQGGARAAFSHTASLAPDYEIFKAYAAHSGALIIDDLDTMLTLAALASRYGSCHHDGVIVLSDSGGAAALVADAIAETGLALADFDEPVRNALSVFAPPSHIQNPFDWASGVGFSEQAMIEGTLRGVSKQGGRVLNLIVLPTNPDMTESARVIGSELKNFAHPTLCVVLPDRIADGAREVFREAQIPFCNAIEPATKAILQLGADRAQSRIPESELTRPRGLPSAATIPDLISGESEFNEIDAKKALRTYGISLNETEFARTKAEAVRVATSLGYPVVLKVVSAEITHKSDVGGVRLNITDDVALGSAWDEISEAIKSRHPGALLSGMSVQKQVSGHLECFIGVRTDPDLGSIITFGIGGTLVELVSDVATLPIPTSPERARHALSQLRMNKLLAGYRGTPILDALAFAEAVSRVSWFAWDLRAFQPELDLNPILVRRAGEGVIGVDARMRLNSSSSPSEYAANLVNRHSYGVFR